MAICCSAPEPEVYCLSQGLHAHRGAAISPYLALALLCLSCTLCPLISQLISCKALPDCLPPVACTKVLCHSMQARRLPEEAEERDGKSQEGPQQQEHADPGRGWGVHCEGHLPRHLKAPPNLPPVPCMSSKCQFSGASVIFLSCSESP